MSWDAEDVVLELRSVLTTVQAWAADEHLSDEVRRAYRDCVVLIELALNGPSARRLDRESPDVRTYR